MTNHACRLRRIPVRQREEWNACVSNVAHDFYHRAEYHLLAEAREEGCAWLAVYQDAQRFVAWPYLLLSLSSVPGLEFTDRCDVTSVYGYPGPLTRECRTDESFFPEAVAAICELWGEQKAVSAFTRMNPLLLDVSPLENLGTLSPAGFTVAVNLKVPLDESWAGYRRGHRYEVEKGLRVGLRIWHDQRWQYVNEFERLYAQTMGRKQASGRYRFGKEYFTALRDAWPGACHLLLAFHGDHVAAGAIFTECCGIVQYHLSASSEEYRSLAPTKVLLDGARVWAKGRGNRVLHLGGGIGGSEDSLFSFKAGFSSSRHPFFTWHTILDSARYDLLAAARKKFCADQGLVPEKPSFFPSYRQPLVADPQLSRTAV